MQETRRTMLLGGAASLAALGLGPEVALAQAQSGQQPGQGAAARPASAQGGSKPATAATRDANEAVRRRLDFANTQDFESARRGFVAALPEPVRIPGRDGQPVWNLEPYSFIRTTPEDDAPDTVNPSLWRIAKLNLIHGLFEVVPGMWQVRGYDLSVMSIIRGERGWIVIDPFISSEVASHVWENLVKPNIGDRPITAVIHTHSHIDHFGGVRGIVRQEDVDAGRIAIIAPPDFTAEAVSENIIAGNVMTRRAGYMYGNLVEKGPQGQVSTGLGQTTSTGTATLILPTDTVMKTGDTRRVDGVEMRFINAPASEAPSEMMFYIPSLRVFHAAENVNHTLHNLYTLRGAKFRDGLKWSTYLQEALDMFGDQWEVVLSSHHFPTWGREAGRELVSKQRDAYRYLHDQTLRMANMGMTPREIGEAMQLPDSLDRFWPNRGYYGTTYHNARAQYGLYLGWFDAVPANLHPHTPEESAKRYVAAIGGADAVMRQGREAFERGDYRWVGELVNHLVFAEPDNQAAREMLADAYEQMGYQAESGQWRNFYLVGATELRRGVRRLPIINTASPDMVRAMPLGTFINYLGVRLNPEKAANKTITINLALQQPDAQYVLGVENSALHWSEGRQAQNADATLTLSRAALNDIILGARTLEDQVMSGAVQVSGQSRAVGEFVAMLDTFDPWFEIARP